MDTLPWRPPGGPALPWWPSLWPDHPALFAELEATVDWDTRMKARKTASFGRPYDYSQLSYAARPMHPASSPLVTAVTAAVGFEPDNCLLNLYPDGEASMGFHSDNRSDLEPGTGVAIVSLGAARTLVMRDNHERARTHAAVLAPGSLVVLPDAVQDAWQHAVPREPGAGARISVTLRRLRRAG